MLRDFQEEIRGRTELLRGALQASGATGFVFGNSGGKDSALAGILCKMACEDTVGIMLPCRAPCNYTGDRMDALALARQYRIETRTIDLTSAREALVRAVEGAGVLPAAWASSSAEPLPTSAAPTPLPDAALTNIAPRLRMTALYAVAAAENRLVVGTGNRSERYMGYFTKWGDGAYDINPIADLLVTEVYAFLEFLGAPESILTKAPSAGLFEGQTDEADMGVTYAAIDRFLTTGEASAHDRGIIDRYHRRSEHKRRPPVVFGNDGEA